MQRGLVADERGRQLIIVPMQIAIGLDYDCANDKIYWTDIEKRSHSLYFANGDGSNITKIWEEGLFSPEGIAVDWTTGNVYYTDSGTDKIGVVSGDGQWHKVLIKEGLVNPRDIVLDLARG